MAIFRRKSVHERSTRFSKTIVLPSKNDGFEGVPGCANSAKLWITHALFSLKFWANLSHNRHINDAKSFSKQEDRKHRRKPTSISIFWVPAVIFGRFWDPLGSQNRLQNWPWEWKLGLNWALGVPREPQEPILVDFWLILESFWVPGWSFWDPSGTLFGAYGSKQQQIAAKMAILGPYLVVFCSKKQQTSANSYK